MSIYISFNKWNYQTFNFVKQPKAISIMSDRMGEMIKAKTVKVRQYVKTTHTQSQTQRESE